MSSNFPIYVVGLPPNCIKPVLDSQDSSKRKILQGAEPPPENQFGPEGSLAGDRMKGQRLEPSEPSEHMTKNMEIYGNLWKSWGVSLGFSPRSIRVTQYSMNQGVFQPKSTIGWSIRPFNLWFCKRNQTHLVHHPKIYPKCRRRPSK